MTWTTERPSSSGAPGAEGAGVDEGTAGAADAGAAWAGTGAEAVLVGEGATACVEVGAGIGAVIGAAVGGWGAEEAGADVGAGLRASPGGMVGAEGAIGRGASGACARAEVALRTPTSERQVRLIGPIIVWLGSEASAKENDREGGEKSVTAFRRIDAPPI